MKSIAGRTFFCSWSGGKDSCLALYRAIQGGGRPGVLLTMCTENGERSRSHGLSVAILQRQALALGVPLVMRAASWQDYEQEFLSALGDFRKQGIECGVFGDIDLEPHLEWVERICSSVAVDAYEPLWKCDRRDLLEEFCRLGFKAMIISVKQDVLDTSFLGRTLDAQIISEMEEAGIDASGEEGEYHTLLTDGPLFSFPLEIEVKGQVVSDGYCFLDVVESASD